MKNLALYVNPVHNGIIVFKFSKNFRYSYQIIINRGYMEMSAILNALVREGKPNLVRKDGFVPGIIYGEGKETSRSVKFDSLELQKQLRMKGHNLKMSVQMGTEIKDTIVKEIQRSPISYEIQHIDLQVIAWDEKVSMSIPVMVTGREDMERLGLIVEVSAHEIEMTGPINKLPESIVIDVSGKEAGYAFNVSDVELDEGITIHNSPEETLVIVSAPKAVKPEDEAEAEVIA